MKSNPYYINQRYQKAQGPDVAFRSSLFSPRAFAAAPSAPELCRGVTAQRAAPRIFKLSQILKIWLKLVHFLFCHLELMRKKCLFLVIACLVAPLLTPSRHHEWYSTCCMKWVWHPGMASLHTAKDRGPYSTVKSQFLLGTEVCKMNGSNIVNTLTLQGKICS